MRVAITGASGFVGRHVIAELAKTDVDLVAALKPGSTPPAFLSDRNDRISVARVDLHDQTADPFEDMGAPDVVVHLAWGGLPNYKSLHHFETELPAQYKFLNRLIRAGLRTLLVTGTCFEYGMQSGALGEDMEARPTNPYGFAKDALRRELQYLKAVHPFSLVWARLFYMHGEGQAPNSLLQQLQRAVERGEPAFNMSGGEQLRDYLPVTEVARHLVTLALARQDIGVINVCSGQAISVRKMVEDWQKKHGSRIALNLGHYPYTDYEPFAFWGDRSRLDSIIGCT